MIFDGVVASDEVSDGVEARQVAHRPLPLDERASAGLLLRAEKANASLLKRALDIGVSLGGLMFLAPLLLVLAALIKLDSRGPVFFRQERYGRDGEVFRIYKFRSMRVLEARGGFRQAERDDDRVTRVGRFIRRTSLDELPQLLNVLRGEMSLVGPRPHALAMDDAFARRIPCYRDRHLVRPGLTGLAQIEGHRGPTNTLDHVTRRLTHDRVYIRTWSIWSDLRILVLTPVRLLRGDVF